MTKKQQLFIQHYLSTQNATKSAIMAGYSVKSAYSIANKLLKKAEIKNFVEQQMNKRTNELIATRSEREQLLTEFMRDSELDTKHRLRAIELLSKLQGDFIVKSSIEVKTPDTLSELILKEYESNGDKD